MEIANEPLPTERALGVVWYIKTDVLSLKITIKTRPSTKRGILSVVGSVYDPLGMTIPFVVPTKILLQQLCRYGYGWDDQAPPECQERWERWLQDLNLLHGYIFYPQMHQA